MSLSVVTGAFGYTGRHIAQRLLSAGEQVMLFTCSPAVSPFGDRVNIAQFDFDSLLDLTRNLEGASVLYNTYWVRFQRREMTFNKAIKNSRVLICAAKEAGVGRIVHISITGASSNSTLPYFRGKGLVEEAIVGSEAIGVGYASELSRHYCRVGTKAPCP